MAQQGHHAVPDEIGRRLVAGHKERDAGGDQFGHVQPVVGRIGRQQRDDVVARLAHPLGDEVGEIGAHLHQAGLGNGHRFGPKTAAAGKEAVDVQRPAPKMIHVRRRRAQELQHDDGRQRVGQRRDEIKAGAAGNLVEQIIDHGLHARGQCRQPLRLKERGQQPAQARVCGRVGVTHTHGIVALQEVGARTLLRRELVEQVVDAAGIREALRDRAARRPRRRSG